MKELNDMGESALVSIIVPVYNMGTKLADSVHALVKQTYKNIEIILVDDGSKDNSLDVCKMIANEDLRVKYFHTENRGSGPARNYGIAKAAGRYLYFPDADDLLVDTAIERLVSAIEKSNADVVVFGYRSIDVSGKVVSVKQYPSVIVDGKEARSNYENYYGMDRPYSIQGAPWNKFFRKDIIQKYSVEYPPLRRHQDDAFIARYITHCNTIQFIDDVLYTYYTNNLKTTWDKYPVAYLDAVIGLYEDRKKTILTWCESDKQTHDMVLNEYICNVIKGLELSFSAKYGFKNKNEQKKWIKENIIRCGLTDLDCPEITSKYQRCLMSYIKDNKLGTVYTIMSIKVKCEKSGALALIRKIF